MGGAFTVRMNVGSPGVLEFKWAGTTITTDPVSIPHGWHYAALVVRLEPGTPALAGHFDGQAFGPEDASGLSLSGDAFFCAADEEGTERLEGQVSAWAQIDDHVGGPPQNWGGWNGGLGGNYSMPERYRGGWVLPAPGGTDGGGLIEPVPQFHSGGVAASLPPAGPSYAEVVEGASRGPWARQVFGPDATGLDEWVFGWKLGWVAPNYAWSSTTRGVWPE
jgi:hypothetical protein